MFERILVVFDDPGDRRVLLPSLRILARPRAHVIVVKTVPFLETIVEMPHELSPEAEGDEEAAEVFVSALVHRLKDEGLDAEGFTSIGLSGLTLAAVAERVAASLIVVASGLAAQIGSLLRATPVPIFVVPALGLLAAEATPPPLHALETAGTLALHCGSAITFFPGPSARGELVVRPGTMVPDVLPVFAGVVACSETTSDRDLVRMLQSSPIPLLLLRSDARCVRAEEPPRIAIPVHSEVPLGVAIWTRHTPTNPLLGAGDPGG